MKTIQIVDSISQWFQNSAFKRSTLPKLFSILFAIIFWIYVMDQVNPEMTKVFEDVKVTYLNTSLLKERSLTVVDPLQATVNVKVKGRRSDVMKVDTEDLRLSCDVGDLREGMNTIEIIDKIYTDNVKIDSLSMADISITIEKIVTREKPVQLKYVGSLKDDMSYDPGEPLVSKVMVTGSTSAVDSIVAVMGKVDINSLATSGNLTVSLIAIDKDENQVKGVTLSANSTDVSTKVYKIVKLPIKVSTKGTVKSGFGISAISQDIKYVNFKNKLDFDEETSSKVPLYIATEDIDITGLTGVHVFKIPLKATEELKKLIDVTQVTITVDIEKIVTKKIEIGTDKLVFKNLPTSFKVKSYENKILSIGITDFIKVFEKFNLDDIELSADLKDLNSGVHNVEIKGSYKNSPISGFKGYFVKVELVKD